MVKSARPTTGAATPKGNVIPGGAPGTARTAPPHDANKYWADYFKRKDESPGQVLQTVYMLRGEEKFDEVEACIRAYLVYRVKHAEPWMYEMLAISVEKRKGPAAEVKTLLGYAAYLALKSKNPNPILNVADMLHRRRIYDKVGPVYVAKDKKDQIDPKSAGEMIDLVMTLVPHRAEPILMSMLVAIGMKDPARMAVAAEKALALGWPGSDEPMRRNVRTQVETLATTLRDDGREKEADDLLAKLPGSMSRDLYVRLSWDGVDDIDLLVDEPLGATAQLFKTPRTIFGGAIVTNGFGKHPEEIYVCPRAFSGTYKIRVEKIFQPEANPAKEARLEIITHEGTPQEKRETHTIDLASPKPITVKLENGRRKDVLPFLAPPPAIAPGADPRAVSPGAEKAAVAPKAATAPIKP